MNAPYSPFVQPSRPMPEQGKWTYDDWAQLPNNGWKYEVLNGDLYMTPPPTVAHQDASGELLTQMRMYAKRRKLGKVFCAPIGVRLPNQPVPVEPDIVFVKTERIEIVTKQYIEGAPDLVVEVLSPSNWTYDRQEKYEVYRAAGVSEYWIVDTRAKTIEVFNLEGGAYILSGKFVSGQAATSTALIGFSIPVDEVFAE